MNAVKIIAFKIVFCGIFDNIPLDGILGVIIHIFFIGSGEKINDFVAIEHKHGGREGNGLTVNSGFGEKEFNLVAEEIKHTFVIGKGFIGEIAAFAGGGGDFFESWKFRPIKFTNGDTFFFGFADMISSITFETGEEFVWGAFFKVKSKKIFGLF